MPGTTEQDTQLRRVKKNIEPAVIEWLSSRFEINGATFYGGEFEAQISSSTGCTPGSPMRILRLLSSDGIVQYRVIDRSQSLYKILAIQNKLRL